MTAFDAICDSLATVTGNGTRRNARCPAHEDHTPSLSVTATEDRVLIHCHAGCSTDEVLTALNLTVRDLYNEPRGGDLAQYQYTDVHGKPTRIVHRREGKQFSQSGDKTLSTLYRLPLVIAAVKLNKPVYLVEGESDVHALETLDVVATTGPQGATNFNHVDVSPLKGATVIAVRDRDGAGEKWSALVEQRLGGYVGHLTIVEAAEGKDACDHIAAEHGLADFVPVMMSPGMDEHETDSWAPINLGPYLRGDVVRPQPSIGLARNDGLRLLYPGKEHSIIGEMESGKSWFCVASAVAELIAGNHVVYVHFEECDPTDTIERLQVLGVSDRDIVERFTFVGPEQRVSRAKLDALLVVGPTLVIFDGVNEAMSLHRWGIRDEDGAADFRRHLVKPCTRNGAAVLTCDHVAKDRDTRGRNAIGSVHKGNGLTGSLIMLETAEPFGRGMRGRAHVFVTKDRPGYLRRAGKPTKTPGKTIMGELVVDDTQLLHGDAYLDALANDEPTKKSGILLRLYKIRKDDAVSVDAETPDTADEAIVITAIRRVCDLGQVATLNKVRAASGIKSSRTDRALDRLVLNERLTETTGPRNARVFVSEDQLPDVAK